ncbi:MAG: outer membrane beta-barrel protein [bacterium]|jgi:hypothetical protein
MKRKITLTLIVLIASLQLTQGQILISLLLGDRLNSDNIEFGLNGGFNLSYVRGIDQSKSQNNWELGFYFDIRMIKEKPWFVATGVYVKSNVGGRNVPLNYPGRRMIDDSVYHDFESQDGKIEMGFNTFYVPVNIRYLSKSGIFIEGGAQLGLVFKTHDIYHASVDGHDLTYDVKKGVRNNGLYKWFDGGIDGGIGYKSKSKAGWKIGVWYYVGLTNIYKKDLGYKAYNSSLYVLATIPIGKKKAERVRAEKAKAAQSDDKK